MKNKCGLSPSHINIHESIVYAQCVEWRTKNASKVSTNMCPVAYEKKDFVSHENSPWFILKQ